jgi:hypothetical protein
MSPNGGAETPPPELSHTFTFYRSDDGYVLYLHTV